VNVGPDPVAIPEYLVAFGRARGPSGLQWLERLPGLVAELRTRWELELEPPLGDPPGAMGWIAPARLPDGTEVVLKLSWPHTEAESEAAGLRFFDGRGAVRLVASDEARFALLTERIRPGDDLWSLGVDEANAVAAGVLRRLWREPPQEPGPFRTLAETVGEWNRSYAVSRRDYPKTLVQAAVDRGRSLVATQSDLVVIHGDFNLSNVLRSSRGEWLAIDPKPLIGDPAYDLAQYLAQRVEAAAEREDPGRELLRQIDSFAGALSLDRGRIAAWAAVKAVGWNWGAAMAETFAALALATGP
jgi:streptomycin 6-kinase